MSTSEVRHSQPTGLSAIIENHSAAIGDHLYLLDARSDRHLSYSQLDGRVARWRDILDELDVAPGDRVGLFLSDPLDFSICFIALLAAGLWIAPLDPIMTFTSARQLNDRTSNLKLRFVLSDQPAPFNSDATWLRLPDLTTAAPGTSPLRANELLSDGGVILSSSGTTGTPKIMALPMAQLLHTAELIATHHGLTPSDRGFNPLPLWHINAEVVGLLAALVAGASLVLEDRFHRTGFWSLVEKHHITWINAVPAIVARLSTLREGELVPSRIRFVRSASAPLSPVLLRQFEENVGVPVVETYGMTEAASQICANPLNGVRKIGSVGQAVGVDLRVISVDPASPGMVCAANDVGRVEIKGPSVILHYEGAGYEARFDAQGWLETGDLGYLDDDDYLFLVGRSDDVINRSGEKIFPREIEEVILGVPGVLGAAVIGLPDDVFGQVPTSFVQLEGVSASTPVDEMRVATKEIQDALVAALSRARRPLFINVVDRLPTHATGKVQKKVLEAGTVPVLFQDHVS